MLNSKLAYLSLALIFGVYHVTHAETLSDIETTTATVATVTGSANAAVIWRHPNHPEKSRILGADANGGVELFNLTGKRLDVLTQNQPAFIDLRDNLVVTGHPRHAKVNAYLAESKGAELQLQAIGDFTVDIDMSGMCLYRSALDNAQYVFVIGADGHIQQWQLSSIENADMQARLVRMFFAGFGASYCLADDYQGVLYLVEENTGAWSFNAEPESDAERTVVDVQKPFGRLEGESKGLALYRDGTGGGYLILSDNDGESFHLYTRRQHYYLGAFQVFTEDAQLGEVEGLYAVSGSFGPDYPGGILLLTDDDNSKYQLVSWQSLVETIDLTAVANISEETAPASITVMPTAETQAVETFGDAADDPAIWVHPEDPAQSLIIGTQKQSGLYVYNLQGEIVQFLPDGRMNNVDLRDGFMLGGRAVTLVAATNRTNKSLAVYALSVENPKLVSVADPISTGFDDPYGLCMHHDRKANKHYIIANDTDGNVKQWELSVSGGKVVGKVKRSFSVGSQTEGCVADDELGHLYIGEENNAIWKYTADPAGGEKRSQVDSVDSPEIVADIEGMSIYYGKNGTGYLLVSNQGADNFALYRREGNNEFLGIFHITANVAAGVDGASETDGLDVTSAPLGGAYPKGLLVVQDGRNLMPDDKQNFKLISWQDIMTAMQIQ